MGKSMSNDSASDIDNINRRKFWLDLARTTAIMTVVFNHAMSRSFSIENGTREEFMIMSPVGSVLKALLYVISRLGVPLFLMISGVLLMERDYEDKDTLKRFITHNWLGLFRTTEIWLAIIFLYLQLMPGALISNHSLKYVIMRFLSTLLFIDHDAYTTMPSMWYMSMILCLYLMIPVLSVAMRRLSARLFYILFAVGIISGMLIPNINTLLQAMGSKVILSFGFGIGDLFSIYLLYVMAGYWIGKGMLSEIRSSYIYIFFTLSLLITCAFQYMIYASAIDYYVRYADAGILISSSLLFEIIRRNAPMQKNFCAPITYISRISFGIYFMHVCIMTGVNWYMNNYTDICFFPKFVILVLSSFLMSVLIIWITSKNRYIAKYLYLIRN